MTAASTILAMVMTPFLTATLAGHYVVVDSAGLVVSTLQLVLSPVLVGAFLNQYFPQLVKSISPFTVHTANFCCNCGSNERQRNCTKLLSDPHVRSSNPIGFLPPTSLWIRPWLYTLLSTQT